MFFLIFHCHSHPVILNDGNYIAQKAPNILLLSSCGTQLALHNLSQGSLCPLPSKLPYPISFKLCEMTR